MKNTATSQSMSNSEMKFSEFFLSMFKSKRRPVVTPGSAHRIAGRAAQAVREK